MKKGLLLRKFLWSDKPFLEIIYEINILKGITRKSYSKKLLEKITLKELLQKNYFIVQKN